MTKPDFRPAADEAWDALLRQLPHQPQARPRPFFYGRVQARLAAQASAARPLVPGWLRRPAFAALLGALVLSLSGDCAAGGTAAGAAGPVYAAPPMPPR
ncbi:hypothetical protein [Hymenobacter convexus]|uniref:hypothetical protein n=1 Tax=Hymenobacter sp. CA1UV-4 TaxID=3063782 RepID=UPI002712274D|nr:hypothetical protein [Hymenobacter sp. CA1UV-4]MDO7853209.1 hypothetical protein [Hymenobacter sp. CA1UV-4]